MFQGTAWTTSTATGTPSAWRRPTATTAPPCRPSLLTCPRCVSVGEQLQHCLHAGPPSEAEHAAPQAGLRFRLTQRRRFSKLTPAFRASPDTLFVCLFHAAGGRRRGSDVHRHLQRRQVPIGHLWVGGLRCLHRATLRKLGCQRCQSMCMPIAVPAQTVPHSCSSAHWAATALQQHAVS